MGWDGMGRDGMKTGMGRDGMGWVWDGTGWDGMGWDGTGRDGMGWDGMGWDGRARRAWRGWRRARGQWRGARSGRRSTACQFDSKLEGVTTSIRRARPAETNASSSVITCKVLPMPGSSARMPPPPAMTPKSHCTPSVCSGFFKVCEAVCNAMRCTGNAAKPRWLRARARVNVCVGALYCEVEGERKVGVGGGTHTFQR